MKILVAGLGLAGSLAVVLGWIPSDRIVASVAFLALFVAAIADDRLDA